MQCNFLNRNYNIRYWCNFYCVKTILALCSIKFWYWKTSHVVAIKMGQIAINETFNLPDLDFCVIKINWSQRDDQHQRSSTMLPSRSPDWPVFLPMAKMPSVNSKRSVCNSLLWRFRRLADRELACKFWVGSWGNSWLY